MCPELFEHEFGLYAVFELDRLEVQSGCFARRLGCVVGYRSLHAAGHEDVAVVGHDVVVRIVDVEAFARLLPDGAGQRLGTRPAGLYTAGAAQRLVNRQNIIVGRRVVILGSGDIGMIMARRMTLEGAQVVMVVELMSYLAGLTRNRVQCLDDFQIPLKLAHTITRIEGDERVTGVWVAPVDEQKRPILEQEEFVPCDTVLFSVGLMPENELTRKAGIQIHPVTNGPVVNQFMQTSTPGVFACGNVVHVNDLVDNVSAESALAGCYAAKYAMGTLPQAERTVACEPGRNVRYLCPQGIQVTNVPQKVSLYFRVLQPEPDVTLVARCGEQIIAQQKEFRVNPGEMNHITVETEKLISGIVTVEVQKEG